MAPAGAVSAARRQQLGTLLSTAPGRSVGPSVRTAAAIWCRRHGPSPPRRPPLRAGAAHPVGWGAIGVGAEHVSAPLFCPGRPLRSGPSRADTRTAPPTRSPQKSATARAHAGPARAPRARLRGPRGPGDTDCHAVERGARTCCMISTSARSVRRSSLSSFGCTSRLRSQLAFLGATLARSSCGVWRGRGRRGAWQRRGDCRSTCERTVGRSAEAAQNSHSARHTPARRPRRRCCHNH